MCSPKGPAVSNTFDFHFFKSTFCLSCMQKRWCNEILCAEIIQSGHKHSYRSVFPFFPAIPICCSVFSMIHTTFSL